MSPPEWSLFIVSVVAVLTSMAMIPKTGARMWIILALGAGLAIAVFLPVPIFHDERLWGIAGIAFAAAMAALAWRIYLVVINRQPPRSLRLIVESLQRNARIPVGDTPLVITGRYEGDAVAVRVVLSHPRVGYFVQNPEVDLRGDGTWVADNVCLGHGIDRVGFVQVGNAGKRIS